MLPCINVKQFPDNMRRMTGTAQHKATRNVTVDSGDAGQRIDNFLVRVLKGVPRSHIYRMLRRGEVRVNRGRVKAAYRLETGDDVRLPPVRVSPETKPPVLTQNLGNLLESSVLYEDDQIIALNKPSGLAVHGGSGLAYGAIEALRALRPQQRELELVHRLDRETSGVLLVAKRRSALRQLHELLREGRMDKRYLALLGGNWRRDKVSVTVPLRKNVLRSGERVVRVDPEGKAAHTDFRVIGRYPGALLVEVRLHTGRTHQIRVHAQHLGTPVVGDAKYGDAEINRRFAGKGVRRLFLHAASITFPWGEQGRKLTIEAPLDDEFERVLEGLKHDR